MTPSVKLTSPSLADLYTIPESDWTAISKRVSVALALQQIAKVVSGTLPHFDELVPVCQAWKSTTFATLVGQAGQLGTQAAQSIADFSALETKVASLGDDAPTLPDSIKQDVLAVISRLQQSTQALATSFSGLANEIDDFRTANNNVDVDLQRYQAQLGPSWESLFEPLQSIENATGQVLAEWQTISDDLQSIVSGQVEITMPLVMGLEIQSAIKTWQMIQTETTAFASMAKGQEKYLSGAWLTGS